MSAIGPKRTSLVAPHTDLPVQQVTKVELYINQIEIRKRSASPFRKRCCRVPTT